MANPSVPIRITELDKTFAGGIRAIDRLSLNIAAGEFVAILGPSGCGKSTLLRIIAGLDSATSGELMIEGEVRPAFVFQDAHLLPWRRAVGNVALPLEIRGVDRTARKRAAIEALEAVGLGDAINRFPAELSGGMRMRVSLARALVTQPNLLLLDEPFAALDEITRAALDVQLRALWIKHRMTVIFVTHSITEAAFLADRAIVFSQRPARITLDTRIELGEHRSNSLRGDPAFAAAANRLLQALDPEGKLA